MKKNSKRMKRLFGFLLTLVMVIGTMATTAFAAGETATITINKGAVTTDLEGMKVSAYKVMEVANPDVSFEKWIYKVTEAFDNFFNIDNEKSNNSVEEAFNGTTVYLTYGPDNKLQAENSKPQTDSYIELSGDKAKKLDETYGEADLVSRLTGDKDGSGSSQNALLYTWLEKYIENTKAAAAKTTDSAQKDAKNIVIDGLAEGYYALIFEGVPNGISVKQGILIATNKQTASIDLKAEDIPFEKEVVDSKALDNPGLVWDDTASAAIGDTVGYRITTQVPTLTDYENLTVFKVSDTLSNQRLNEGSVTIKIGNSDAVYDQEHKTYTLDNKVIATLNTVGYTSESKQSSFTLEFATDVLEDYEGQDVLITYTAEITTDAAKINGNTATLDYTNNANPGQLTDKTEVYTYGIKVSKKFSDGSTSYSDVKFELYDGTGTNKLNLTGDSGVYKLVDSETLSKVQELGLTNDGTLTITGLDDDVNYILKETKTSEKFNVVGDITIDLNAKNDPSGMLLDEENTSIKIGDTAAKLTFVNNTSESDGAIAVAVFDVLNQKGFTLPSTGGAGTWMLTIGGIVLIAAAIGLLAVSRKKTSSR